MEHSDELTFADYFNAEKEIYRNITCAALAARWLLDHGFVMPTDAEIKELVAEANRKVLEAWGEIYALAMLKCCLLYTSPSPRDRTRSRMPSSA